MPWTVGKRAILSSAQVRAHLRKPNNIICNSSWPSTGSRIKTYTPTHRIVAECLSVWKECIVRSTLGLLDVPSPLPTLVLSWSEWRETCGGSPLGLPQVFPQDAPLWSPALVSSPLGELMLYTIVQCQDRGSRPCCPQGSTWRCLCRTSAAEWLDCGWKRERLSALCLGLPPDVLRACKSHTGFACALLWAVRMCIHTIGTLVTTTDNVTRFGTIESSIK
jgi:hypothetical protein|mmetsp:Transcript_90344/g.151119  ORF Transcript_90344/g.151119 Transcript_90344/m.151119 type:complete len:220 (-) Transcript_90344:814-1473(-)